jgi:hypothetical protein
MSIYQRLYECYKELCGCELVRTRTATVTSLAEFEALLNLAQPQDVAETAMHGFLRGMYLSNTRSFYKYINNPTNKCASSVLWTSGREVARHFGLSRVAHIVWDHANNRYAVSAHVFKGPTLNETKSSSDISGPTFTLITNDDKSDRMPVPVTINKRSTLLSRSSWADTQ